MATTHMATTHLVVVLLLTGSSVASSLFLSPAEETAAGVSVFTASFDRFVSAGVVSAAAISTSSVSLVFGSVATAFASGSVVGN